MRYSIEGEPLPVVICELDNGEMLKCESGSMAWMTPNMKMETKGGGMGKILGRAFSGESIFLNNYTAQDGAGTIAFASNIPGSIRAFEISPGHDIVAQKNAFLACEAGVDLDIFFQKKLGSGMFGGEGFIMQKLSGQGIAFVEFDGYCKEYELAQGQSMIIDTGYLAAMDDSCRMEIKTISGVKNVVFGGEGLFNTVVYGPGKVVLQSMPVAATAMLLSGYIPSSN